MSTFYFSVGIISRGKGQSAVASASYRSGESLYSNLDEETKYYGKRTVQPETFILAPEHAPEWVYDRETLWNEVEYVENRHNSQLAREVKLALPIELEHELQRELLEEYVKENFVKRGMVADVAIHRDVEHNPHAHIMLTVRPFNEDGTWGNKQKREYLKDENGQHILDEKGKKKFKKIELTDWNNKETLVEWRKNLAEKINEYYKAHGIDEKVSHLSYAEQGLDKIPKHRLERTEYEIEKREKERAELEGREYKPLTTFARLNYEIEKANQELNNLNKKIVDLNEYRQSVKGDMVSQLKAIRDNFLLSDDDYKSLKVVAKRVNGFVDFEKAKDNLNRLDYWKLKLQREKYLIVAKGKVLEKAMMEYKENPRNVLKYGFIPSQFEKEYVLKGKEYQDHIHKYNETISAYNDLRKHSKRAYEIQKEFTNEEFKFLYPEYADKLSDNEGAMELKFKYVELFKKEGVLRHEIPELETNPNRYTKQFDQLKNTIKEWKDVNNSLLILERTKYKHQKEYTHVFNNWNSEKVYAKSILYAETNEQIADKEATKRTLSEKLHVHMKEFYPDVKEKTISKIPDSVKARVLELHLNDESTGKLSADLKMVEKDIEKHEIANFVQSEEQSNQGAGGLFSGLINSVKQDEGRGKDDLESKRQRDKRRRHMKLTKEIGENEL